MKEVKSAAVMGDNEWRNYLRNSKADIFEMIKSAIMVAASDHPQEFQNKRDMIAQTLFSRECCGYSKKRSIDDDQTEIVAEVLKMKEIVERSSEESESALVESLSKLRRMVKSVTILKLTGIGRSVAALRGHASNEVAQISTTLVKEWKCMVDRWLKDSETTHEEPRKKPPEKEISKQQRPMIVRLKLSNNYNNNNDKVDGVGDKKWKGLVDEYIKKESSGQREIHRTNSEKFNASKRRLQEAYAREAERMKKKRRIQVIEPHELIKEGFSLPN